MEGAEREYVLLYDGRCAFCAREAERLRRWTGGRVRLATLQEEYGGEAIPEELKLKGPDGKVYGGAEGLFRALALRPAWRVATWVYFVPGVRWFIDRCYRWVAANRFRISRGCGGETCGWHGGRGG